MTIKERLLKEYILSWNKVYRLTGEELFNESETYFNSDEFKRMAKEYTKADLQDSIDTAVRTYEEEVEKLRVENYYNTEEGKKRKESITKRFDKLYDALKSFKAFKKEEVKHYVKSWLGESWGVHLFETSMEIGLVENVVDDYESFYFGKCFNVYFSNHFGCRFDVNYGTTGCFNPFDDNLQCEYVLGLAKFVNDKEQVNTMQNLVHGYVRESENREKELSNLRYELANPLKYEEMKKVV